MVGDSVFPAWSGWWPSSIHSNTASSLDWHSRKEQAFCYTAHRDTHRTSGPPERMVGSQSEQRTFKIRTCFVVVVADSGDGSMWFF